MPDDRGALRRASEAALLQELRRRGTLRQVALDVLLREPAGIRSLCQQLAEHGEAALDALAEAGIVAFQFSEGGWARDTTSVHWVHDGLTRTLQLHALLVEKPGRPA